MCSRTNCRNNVFKHGKQPLIEIYWISPKSLVNEPTQMKHINEVKIFYLKGNGFYFHFMLFYQLKHVFRFCSINTLNLQIIIAYS